MRFTRPIQVQVIGMLAASINRVATNYVYRISSNRAERPRPLFPSGPYSTRPLYGAGLYFFLGPIRLGLYTGLTSIYARSSCSDFRRVLFYAVYSSKLESDIVALSLEHIMEASVAVRPGLVLNSVVIAGTRG